MRVGALIADDEPVARAGLREMLAAHDWVACVGETANGPATVEAIDRLRPELVFLDVEMPGLRGTEVLARVTHQPYVVFTTAYSQHAVTAFELGALDYLLKPFGPARLAAAMERVRAAVGEPAAHPALERLADTFGRGPIRRLFVRSGGALLPLAVETVAWFEASGDYVIAHVAQGAPGSVAPGVPPGAAPPAGRGAPSRHIMHLALARLEARLDPARFVRIHRTHIVNLDHVRRFRPDGTGRLVAEMADGTRLTVSRARAQELRRLGA